LKEEKNPTGWLYHLSHGQHEPVGVFELPSLPRQNGGREKQTAGQFGHFAPFVGSSSVSCYVSTSYATTFFTALPNWEESPSPIAQIARD
jgi:hypothetical protein